MKIFYGVQGTGNGHITRARVMAKELASAGFEVTYLFSGRSAADYVEMAMFKDYLCYSGLTFQFNKGEVQYLNTARNTRYGQFFKEIGSLDLGGYDLIISDFEPVTAWAAKKQGRKLIGIGHQYAFNYAIPKAGVDPIAAMILKYFAPVDVGIGLHWHHFGQPILPPMIEIPPLPKTLKKNKIIVYLPFETLDDIVELLKPFSDFDFHVYSNEKMTHDLAHIQCTPVSRHDFAQDFADSIGIISNAGFELPSEALLAGKKILVKPLHSQMEQISNAFALKQLGYGQTMFDLDRSVVEAWLDDQKLIQVSYPNVAKIMVAWIAKGMPTLDQEYISSVWNEVKVSHHKI